MKHYPPYQWFISEKLKTGPCDVKVVGLSVERNQVILETRDKKLYKTYISPYFSFDLHIGNCYRVDVVNRDGPVRLLKNLGRKEEAK